MPDGEVELPRLYVGVEVLLLLAPLTVLLLLPDELERPDVPVAVELAARRVAWLSYDPDDVPVLPGLVYTCLVDEAPVEVFTPSARRVEVLRVPTTLPCDPVPDVLAPGCTFWVPRRVLAVAVLVRVLLPARVLLAVRVLLARVLALARVLLPALVEVAPDILSLERRVEPLVVLEAIDRLLV